MRQEFSTAGKIRVPPSPDTFARLSGTMTTSSISADMSIWMYLTTPFLFKLPGFDTEEIEPWKTTNSGRD